MSAQARGGNTRFMARYLFHHRHQPHECSIVSASFKGNASRFATRRRLPAIPGEHEIWWTVEAEAEADAAELLTLHVAQRTTVTRVSEVEIP